MEQAQKEKQQVHGSSVTSTKAHLADAEAFDSVRQAALLLFKQRTKDLTRLATVEAQSQQVEAELQQAQTAVTELSAQQASLEALVEEEQQRVRQRERRLTELHGALVQIDEEQRMYQKLQQSAEAATDAAAKFIARFTSVDGRLFQLLSQAKERVGGRTARDVETVLTQVQQRLIEAVEQQQRLLNEPFRLHSSVSDLSAVSTSLTAEQPVEQASTEPSEDVIGSFAVILQGWMGPTESWSRHIELTSTVDALRQVYQWLTEEKIQKTSNQICVAQIQTDAPVSDWPTLSMCPTLCPNDSSFFTMTGDKLQAIEQEHTFRPICTLRVVFNRLTSICAKCRFVFPENVQTEFTLLETNTAAMWSALLRQRQEWDVLAEGAAQASERAATARQAKQTALTNLQMLTDSCVNLTNLYHQRTSDLASGKEIELLNYAAAWQKGWRTISAQCVSQLAMQTAVEARKNEAAQTRALMQNEAEIYAQEMHVCYLLLQEQQMKLTAAQQRLEEVLTQKAALEGELAAAQQLEREAQQQLEKILSDVPASTAEAESGEAGNSNAQPNDDILFNLKESYKSAACTLTSVTACSSLFAEWAATLDTRKEHIAGAGASVALLDALCHTTEETKGGSLDLIRVALQHVATTLQLPAEILHPDVLTNELLSRISCLKMLAAEEQAARSAAETHRAFMAEAQAEMFLLRQELSADD